MTIDTKLQHWTGHIKNWQMSGLSRRAYCGREGLKLSTFDYWVSRIRAAEKLKLASKQRATESVTLVPVRVTGKASDDGLILRSPGGWEVRLPGGIDAEQLKVVVKCLP